MKAEIITIGDEILIGQVIDTNSAWIAQRLNEIGIAVAQITSVSDQTDHIIEALNLAASRVGVILITGGLGPTKDDVTKKTLAHYFNVDMRMDEASLNHIKQFFANKNRPLLDVNIKQAEVPENCTVLLNKNGTAPGTWFNHKEKIYIAMPGVPFEMMYLMEEEVLPRLKKQAGLSTIIHQTMLTAGLGESFLAQLIADIEDSLPTHIKLAYLPKLNQVRLRLSGSGLNEITLKKEIQYYYEQLQNRIGDYVICDADKPLEKVVLDELQKNQLTLAVAESCTGGHLAQLLTQHPGCSVVFSGGVVSYSNSSKQALLGVTNDTLELYGAVSEETVTQMAAGVVKKFGTDYGIAITGIAGPDGGTPDKPVGTVWIAVADKSQTKAQKFQFGNKRIQNIERSAMQALIMLIQHLKTMSLTTQ